MLKIKEERKQDLEKFGFELHRGSGYYYYLKSDYYSAYIVFPESGDLLLRANYEGEELSFELDLLYDLIKNDMVEKEEE